MGCFLKSSNRKLWITCNTHNNKLSLRSSSEAATLRPDSGSDTMAPNGRKLYCFSFTFQVVSLGTCGYACGLEWF